MSSTSTFATSPTTSPPGGAPIWVAHVVAGLVLIALVAAVWTGFWSHNAGWGLIASLAVMTAVGWFLAARLPSNVLGWLLLAVAALTTITVPTGLLGLALRDTAPEAAAWLLWIGYDRPDLETWSWIPPVGIMMTQIPLRFPTGRLPSPAWRWFSRWTIVAIVLAAAAQSTFTPEAAPGVASPAQLTMMLGSIPVQFVITSILLLSSFGVSITSLVIRYRAGGPTERAQIRWMTWAIVVVGVSLAVDAFVLPGLTVLHQWILFAFALVPVAIGVAVLRYGLFEIDRIISRTVSYSLVTAFAVGVYALIVTSVTWLLPAAPSLAVAGATLAAAAVCLPVLRWVQRRVDRRFDRERYVAQRVVDEFGSRLRTGADPHAASADLADAVSKTLQPSGVGLWLSQRPSSSRISD